MALAGEVGGRGGAALPPAPTPALASTAGVLIPEQARKEVRLMRYELDNKRVLAAFQEAEQTGGLQGTIGNVDISAVDVNLLSQALELAKEVGCRTPEAHWHRDVADALLALRVAVVAGDWSRLVECIAEVNIMNDVKPDSHDAVGTDADLL